MQGYPFGTFLFWKVEPEKSAQFKFYGFVQNYHERDAAHCPELGTLPNRELTAVLDGQQRLTALNIGLRGSLAIKEPNKWRSNPGAFPRRTLHLDLFATRGDDEEGERFSFRFLEPEKAAADTEALWYPVASILPVPNPAALFQWLHAKLNARGQSGDDALFNRASEALHRLYVIVHSAPTITFYQEQSQELERVLRIFIRMNSGGRSCRTRTCCSASQWRNGPPSMLARRFTISSTRSTRSGRASTSKDFVLKAGLMLAEIASVGFR